MIESCSLYEAEKLRGSKGTVPVACEIREVLAEVSICGGLLNISSSPSLAPVFPLLVALEIGSLCKYGSGSPVGGDNGGIDL